VLILFNCRAAIQNEGSQGVPQKESPPTAQKINIDAAFLCKEGGRDV
jgi:hypothetical protein